MVDFGKIAPLLPIALTILGTIVEISPIKINPISFFLKLIGDIMLKDIKSIVENNTAEIKSFSEKLESFRTETNKRFDDYERDGIEQKAVDMRNEVINFAENLKLGRRYSDKQYEHIFDVISDYHEYCKKHEIQNHYIDEAHEIIRENARKQYPSRKQKSEVQYED